MDSRINHHRVFVWADISDFFIHIEEVAVTLCNDIFTQTVDSFGEVKEYGKTGVVYAEALVAAFFGSAAGNVTRNEVTECRITAFQVVVAVFLGNIFSLQCTFLQFLGIFQLLRNPNAAIVTQRYKWGESVRKQGWQTRHLYGSKPLQQSSYMPLHW